MSNDHSVESTGVPPKHWPNAPMADVGAPSGEPEPYDDSALQSLRMTVRDKFAKAVLSFVIDKIGQQMTVDPKVIRPIVADVCYQFADAMMERRKRR